MSLGWNNIILEGFCMRGTLPLGKYYYEVISVSPFKTRKTLNPDYNPKDKKPKKPKYCKNKVCQECYFNDCPHLAIADVPIKVYPKMMDKLQELYDNSEDEDWEGV